MLYRCQTHGIVENWRLLTHMDAFLKWMPFHYISLLTFDPSCFQPYEKSPVKCSNLHWLWIEILWKSLQIFFFWTFETDCWKMKNVFILCLYFSSVGTKYMTGTNPLLFKSTTGSYSSECITLGTMSTCQMSKCDPFTSIIIVSSGLYSRADLI